MSDTVYYRKCIKIRAEDSPNVIFALEQIRRGLKPTNEAVCPGVLTWARYQEKLNTWEPRRKCEGLDAEWYEGHEYKLIPKEWLNAAEAFAEWLITSKSNRSILARYMGVDSGAGGDDSAWCVGDRLGVLDIVSMKTPDTNHVYGTTLEMRRKWNVSDTRIIFDLGGGGTEHVNRLRASGYPVRATGFGKQPKIEARRGMKGFEEKRNAEEDAYAYLNRRSEMYYDARIIMERTEEGIYVPKNWNGSNIDGFGLPKILCAELRRQLECVPMDWDGEGRFKLLPKDDPKRPENPKTFRNLIGRSPDQADAFVLMLFGMTHKPIRMQAGAG